MLENLALENILFLDIETVPQFPVYNELPEPMRLMWDHKAKFLSRTEQLSSEELYNRAGIYAEFGKIICISTGFFSNGNGSKTFRIKSFYGDEEKEVLNDFGKLLQNHFSRSNQLLCAHNGKEFDFPFL